MQRYQVQQQDCQQPQLQLQQRRVRLSQDYRIKRHLKKQDCNRSRTNRQQKIGTVANYSTGTKFNSAKLDSRCTNIFVFASILASIRLFRCSWIRHYSVGLHAARKSHCFSHSE
ncbi:hypothetical protein ANTQUA_LOCUS2914 [Anthophora quadrimaculata]